MTKKQDLTNPKDLIGSKKTRLSLVPKSGIIYEALAFEDGAAKYGAYNWRSKKVRASIYIDALERHIAAWFDSREEDAKDSGKPHLGHAKACLGILIDAYETGNLLDDRPVAGNASALLIKYDKSK